MDKEKKSIIEHCYLVALVCDIRNFTELTSKVDNYNMSRLSISDKVTLLNDYKKYVADSQNITITSLLKGISIEKGNYNVERTGDGLLLVIKMCNEIKKINTEKNITMIITLIKNLMKLIDESDPAEKMGKISVKTKELVREHGYYLGITPEMLKTGKNQANENTTMLRLGAGISLGLGFLNRSTHDAFGHPINLAFRLCDKATRWMNGKMTPSILFCKNFGRILEEMNITKKKNFIQALDRHNRELKVYDEPVTLKGVEEQWCYSLEIKKQ